MSFLKQLVNMLIHFNFETIYHQKISETIKRIFVFFLVLFLIISGKFYYDFTKGFNEFEKAMQNTPYFTISGGELNIETPQPYYPIPEEKQIIIDTSGSTSPSILEGAPYGFLITKDKVYSKSSNYETRSFDLKVINDISGLSSVTRNDVTQWIMGFKGPLYIIIVIIISLYQLFAKTVSMFFLTLIVLVISSIMKKSFRYSSIFNISAYSLLLSIFLYWIRSMIVITIPMFFILYWGFAILYGFMAVKKYTGNSIDETPMVVE